MPQTPPQNADDQICGIPNGCVAVVGKGGRGVKFTAWSSVHIPWWKSKTERNPAINGRRNRDKAEFWLIKDGRRLVLFSFLRVNGAVLSTTFATIRNFSHRIRATQ
jgi:hypothetical protein